VKELNVQPESLDYPHAKRPLRNVRDSWNDNVDLERKFIWRLLLLRIQTRIAKILGLTTLAEITGKNTLSSVEKDDRLRGTILQYPHR